VHVTGQTVLHSTAALQYAFFLRSALSLELQASTAPQPHVLLFGFLQQIGDELVRLGQRPKIPPPVPGTADTWLEARA